MLASPEITTLAQAKAIAGSLGYPSKMPGTSFGIPAARCKIGQILAKLRGSTCNVCYADQGRGQYGAPSVVVGQERRYERLDAPQWVEAMVFMLRRAHGLDGHKVNSRVTAAGHHRWHDSGDLQSVQHLRNIVAVANLTPEIAHWLPTRELKLVRSFAKWGGVVPSNLLIRVSAYMVDGAATQHWPHVSLVHDRSEAAGRVCPAPTTGGKCADCRACWDHGVAAVSYHVH